MREAFPGDECVHVGAQLFLGLIIRERSVIYRGVILLLSLAHLPPQETHEISNIPGGKEVHPSLFWHPRVQESGQLGGAELSAAVGCFQSETSQTRKGLMLTCENAMSL